MFFILNVIFYSLAIIGLLWVGYNHLPAIWIVDPIAAIVIGLSLILAGISITENMALNI